MNWHKYFSDMILERGYLYFKQGRVEDLFYEDGTYNAIVKGNEYYHVEIFDSGNRIFMECDCPHAQEGNYCKHMAAVLFEIESKGNDDIIYTKKDDIVKMVYDLNESDLKEFLIEVLQIKSDVLSLFKSTYYPSEKDIRQKYLSELQDIYLKGYDYEFEEDCDQFCNELSNYLDNQVETLISQSFYQLAFELVMQVFKMLDQMINYDFNAFPKEVAEKCLNKILKITESCEEYVNEYIINQLFEMVAQQSLIRNSSLLADFLYNEFNDEEYIDIKIDFAKEKIDKLLNLGYPQSAIHWFKLYLNQLNVKYVDIQEMEKCVYEYFDDNVLFDSYLSYLIKNQHYDRCITHINTHIEKYPYSRLSSYYLKLKEVYTLTNQVKKYEECLVKLITEYQGGIELFKEYKQLFTKDEWQIKKNELFNQITYNRHIGDFYVEENMIEELIKETIKRNDFLYYKNYEEFLKNAYPNECIEIYVNYINELLKPVTNRNVYEYACDCIQSLSKIQGGKEKAKELINKYLNLYQRRSALKRELKRIRL